MKLTKGKAVLSTTHRNKSVQHLARIQDVRETPSGTWVTVKRKEDGATFTTRASCLQPA